jgi:N-acetylmuramate 1-kinase
MQSEGSAVWVAGSIGPDSMSRERLIAAFVRYHGYGAARAEPLAQDASFRRYLRLTGGPRAAVLMDAPPPEDIGPFVRIAGHLAGIGVSVPEIFAADEAEGLLLEEDLGDRLVSGWLGRPPPNPFPQGEGEGAAVMMAAVNTLLAIQRAPPPADLPAWDAAVMATTALATLFDWWWPAMFGARAPNAVRQDIAAALEAMLAPIAAGPLGFVHRDFFAGNLLWLPQRSGIRRIGVLDFQNAAIGHPAYDLASLLQDGRRDIPAELAERAIAHYLVARPELDRAAFHAAYAACTAQRHLRIVGQWVRLARRDGRPAYLMHGPRTWRLLQQALREPATTPLREAMDRWIPPDRRCNPPDLAA